MVDLISFQHPLRVAEEIRLLDTLTHGRLEVGVGAGGFNEHRHWGIDPSEGAAMFEVALPLVRRFLTENGFDYSTRWWTGIAPHLAPEPIQLPHPPLWLAVAREESVEAAARLGLNCQASMCGRDVLASRVALYRDTWRALHPGTEPGRFAALVDVIVNDDGVSARHAGERFHARKLDRLHRLFAARPGGFVRSEERRRRDERFEELSFPELVDQGLVVCGDVEECAAQLARLADTGVDSVTAWMPFGDVDLSYAQRSLQLLCEEVIPLVESRSAAAER